MTAFAGWIAWTATLALSSVLLARHGGRLRSRADAAAHSRLLRPDLHAGLQLVFRHTGMEQAPSALAYTDGVLGTLWWPHYHVLLPQTSKRERSAKVKASSLK